MFDSNLDNTSNEEKDSGLSAEELEFKRKYLKARTKTIDLFGRHMDNIKLKNKIKEQRDEIERQKKKIELSYKRARKRTIELFGKHTDLKKAKKRIEFQQSELQKSNDELAKKDREISASLDYAKKIQEAILPSKKTIREYIKDFFIIYKPRDVVSGDFYWFFKRNNEIFIAIADCTGHGIPGAFMSVMSHTLLNSIIADKRFSSPALILKELNKSVVAALKQKRKDENVQADGLDISLCAINLDTREIEISNANQSAFLVVNNELSLLDSTLYSVGGNISNTVEPEYENQVIQIRENMYLYMMSDGFKDQFGGPKYKKFGLLRLKEAIKQAATCPISCQKNFIETKFDDWRSDRKQIDDVLFMGINLDSVVSTF